MTGLEQAFGSRPLLLEGALGERLKREYGILPHDSLALAAHVHSPRARDALAALWGSYYAVAKGRGLPFLATTPTRRANRTRVGGSPWGEALLADNVAFLREVQGRLGGDMFAGALVGCHGDAYTGADCLPEAEAEAFHAWEAERFAAAGVDFFLAGIMPTLPEAAGMARALAATGTPYIISFMLGPDGALPDGTPINTAIAVLDEAASTPPLCYITNCVHPATLRRALSRPCNRTERVRTRFRGIQANASPLPAGQLDGSRELRCSAPAELARSLRELGDVMNLSLVGGCCGTDESHLAALADVLLKFADET